MAVRIGFIGTGGIAGAHRRALSQISNAQMVAFCDTDEARAKSAAEEHGGVAYTDYQKMLSKESLDAVYICLPPFAHGEFEDAVIDAGLPFFIEKPIDIDLARAEKCAARIAEKGLITGVGYHWRHMDTVDYLKAEVSGRPIGMALGYWMGGTPGVWWWRKWDTSGGQMCEQTTHIIDLARYFMGEVKSVYAAYTTYRMDQVMEGFEVSDAGTATLTFQSGAVCQIATSCALEKTGNVSLQLHFDGAVADIAGGKLSIRGGKYDEEVKREPETNATVREDTFFVNAVEGTDSADKIRSPYADALKSLRVSLAMNDSAKSGQVIEL